VARARLVLAVADGQRDTTAARGVGRRSGDAVARLVARFQTDGRAALVPGHGGGATVVDPEAARARLLAEVRRAPDPDAAGTATWSLSTLRRALRQAPDGRPGVSAYTSWCLLRGAGRHGPQARRWCETGVVLRKRQRGPGTVTDPDAAPKKSCSRTPPGWGRSGGGRGGPTMRPGRARPCQTRVAVGRPPGSRPTSRTRTYATARPSC
jgi:hypothetical protein